MNTHLLRNPARICLGGLWSSFIQPRQLMKWLFRFTQVASVGLIFAAASTQSGQASAANPVKPSSLLPKVLLIGDSISIGYTQPTITLLEKQAIVTRVKDNCGPTSYSLDRIDDWLGNTKWDVIHFNWGLHDLRIMTNGQHQVELEQYEANLRRLVEKLKAIGAKLIWASTTPVPEGKLNPPRRPADVPRYNEAALRVMKEFGVSVNDLYAFALPRLSESQLPSNVHFKPVGSAQLAKPVAEAIAAALE